MKKKTIEEKVKRGRRNSLKEIEYINMKIERTTKKDVLKKIAKMKITISDYVRDLIEKDIYPDKKTIDIITKGA